MLGEASASEVLSSIEWEKLCIKNNLNKRDKSAAINVRGWTSYFLLSFLNSSEFTVIQKYLQNHGKH